MSESVWDAIAWDPAAPFDAEALALAVRDQQRWSRTYLYPVVRVFSRVAVTLIRIGKRLVPVPLRAHSTMDTLCVWFLRRFVSSGAGTLLVRHFIIETNLLNFIVRNAQVPGLPAVALSPTTLSGLGNRAVIEHDLNVYRVLIGLGRGGGADRPARLDFSMLTVPPIDAEPDTRRVLRLDIQTALCLMNIPFALCLTDAEYRRAVHSLRLDDTLLAVLADLTGDTMFWRWRPAGVAVRIDSGMDVPKAVYEHAVICEYAHEHLRRLARDNPT